MARIALSAPSSSGTSGVLAKTVYDPAAEATPSTTATTFADVDATNLSVTFTVPASGAVVVVLSGITHYTGSAAGTRWNLRSGSSDVAGTDSYVFFNAVRGRCTYHVVVTGLTPGASVTYKWGHATETTGRPVILAVGGAAAGVNRAGQASMIVLAA